MMSVAGTRTPRASKEKTAKSALQNAKSGTDSKVADNPNPKIQPTAEQMRLAQIINDTKESDDPELKNKIEQVIELTGKSKDEAIVALHDCNNDPNHAINMLLEGETGQGEWEMSGKKKKNRQASSSGGGGGQPESAPPNSVAVNNKENRNRGERSRDQEKEQDGVPIRNRGPPRLNRGGSTSRSWRGRESEKNERNLEDSRSHEKSNESHGRGRMMNGRGRGRGGPRSRTFQNRGGANHQNAGSSGGGGGGGGSFPRSIDTWSNSTAEQVEAGGGDNTMSVGNWGDSFPPTEEWDNDDWTGSLSETTVFTPSAAAAASNVSPPLQDTTNAPQSIDLSALLQKSTPVQSSLLSDSQHHSQYLSQYTQQATESIKSAIGIPSSTQSNTYQTLPPSSFNSSSSAFPASSASKFVGGTQSGTFGANSMSSSPPAQQNSVAPQVLQSNAQSVVGIPPRLSTTTSLNQRAKPQRARLPPPSKIPSSAVEMPDDAISSLDVQFGGVEFGSEPAFEFSSPDAGNTYQSVSANASSGLSTSALGKPSSESSVHSTGVGVGVYGGKELVQAASQAAVLSQSTGGVSANALGQSGLTQMQKSTAADLLPFSTQAERKTATPFGSQRSSQSSNIDTCLAGTKSDNSNLSSYTTATNHASAYQSTYQPQKPSAVAFSSHQSAALSSTTGGFGSTLSHQAPSQTQTGFSSTSQAAVSYNAVPSGYQPPTPSSFGTQSSVPAGYQASTSAYSTSGSFPTNQNQSSFGSHQTAAGLSQSSVGSTSAVVPTQGGSTAVGSGGGGGGGYGGAGQQSYGSSSNVTTVQTHTSLHVSSTVPTFKLANSLKDNPLDASSQHSFDNCHPTTSPSTLTTTTNSVLSTGNVSASSALGLTSSVATNTSSMSKASTSMGKSGLPNMPPGVPALLSHHHQYIMSQTGLPLYPQVYSYEDIQMMQRLQPVPGYYDMSFQPATSITGRESTLANAYSATDAKFSRGDSTSPVPTTHSQQQTTQQTFINPATFPPGYGYYYTPGGVVPGGFTQYGTIFPVPPVTNATNTTQFQKPTGYASNTYSSGYDNLSQSQDYKGCYGGSSQNQNKGSNPGGSNSGGDISGSVYGKSSNQLGKSFDKPGFPAGTPPPFNLTGAQTGPMGAASTPYPGPFITMIQHPTTMMHHQLHQESQSSSGQRGGQQSAGQQKPVTGSKQYAGNYWGN